MQRCLGVTKSPTLDPSEAISFGSYVIQKAIQSITNITVFQKGSRIVRCPNKIQDLTSSEEGCQSLTVRRPKKDLGSHRLILKVNCGRWCGSIVPIRSMQSWLLKYVTSQGYCLLRFVIFFFGRTPSFFFSAFVFFGRWSSSRDLPVLLGAQIQALQLYDVTPM